MDGMAPLTSVVIPVKNEEEMLRRCLESLKQVEYPADKLEIIIADGMSRDNSKAVASSCGAKVVPNEKQIVSSGRNRGFEAARGEIIAFTDADCVFDKKWLFNALKYFNDEKVGGVGGITLSPHDSSFFEKAVDSIFSLAEFFRSTVHRKGQSSAQESSDIPGCNAIYRKEALQKVMPVDENLLTGEDVWMNLNIRKAGYKLLLVPDVILWHYRRSSPKKLLRQAYRFAVGRTQIAKKNLGLLNIFHLIAGLSIPAFLLACIFFYIFGGIDLFFEALLAIFTFFIPLISFIKTRSLITAFSVPVAILIFLSGWSAGFLREIFFPISDVKGK